MLPATTLRMTHLRTLLVSLARKGQYGHSRTPKNFYMGDPDRLVAGKRDPHTLYCEYYWSWAKFDMTYEQYQRVARLSCRYRRFVHYVTEVLPAWQPVREIHFADNSVEVVEVSRDGVERQRLVRAPGGDACF